MFFRKSDHALAWSIVVALLASGCATSSQQKTCNFKRQRPCRTVVPAQQAFEFEVIGLVKGPGVITFDKDVIPLERALARAGGVDLTRHTAESLFVAVRNRNYRPAVTNYYALPLVTNGSVGQVLVSTDDLVQVVPQSTTVFGVDRLEEFAGLRDNQGIFRIGTIDEGRDLRLGQLQAATQGKTAAHVNRFLKNEYKLTGDGIDICVITRNNWGGVGTARALVPVNYQLGFIPASSSTSPANNVAPVSRPVVEETNLDRANRFVVTTPSHPTTTPDERPSSQRPGVDGSVERTRQDLGLMSQDPKILSQPTTPSFFQANASQSTPQITAARSSLEGIEILDGDVVSVGNSALMPEVLAALTQSRVRAQLAPATCNLEQIANCNGSNQPKDCFLYRFLMPFETVKANIFNNLCTQLGH